MLAVLLVLALLGAAHCDPEPEPEPKSFTKMIHMPAPKVQHVHKPALQEHAVPVVQHIPFQQTVVRTVNVPKDIVREVPVYVFQDMVLRSPVLKPKVIDVQKTLIKPHIKDVPVEHVRYVKRPYNVVHTRYVKQPFPQYRKVIIPKVKVVHKTLNRVIEVPKLHIRDKVKHVIKPYPVIRKRIVKKPVDVPIHVDVPTPVVTNRHVTHTRKVPVQVNVVRKVHVPKKVVLKELVPIPVKAGHGGSTSTRISRTGVSAGAVHVGPLFGRVMASQMIRSALGSDMAPVIDSANAEFHENVPSLPSFSPDSVPGSEGISSAGIIPGIVRTSMSSFRGTSSNIPHGPQVIDDFAGPNKPTRLPDLDPGLHGEQLAEIGEMSSGFNGIGPYNGDLRRNMMHGLAKVSSHNEPRSVSSHSIDRPDPRRRVGRIVTVRYGYDMAPVSRVYTSRVGYVSGGLVRGPGGVVISGPGGEYMGGPGAVDMEGPIPGLGGPLDAGIEGPGGLGMAGAGAALGGSVSGAFSSGFGDFEGELAAARGGGSSFGFQDPLTGEVAGGDSGMGVSLPDGRSSDFNEMSDIGSSIGMRRKPGHYGGAGGYYGDATLGEDIQLAQNIAAGGLGGK